MLHRHWVVLSIIIGWLFLFFAVVNRVQLSYTVLTPNSWFSAIFRKVHTASNHNRFTWYCCSQDISLVLIAIIELSKTQKAGLLDKERSTSRLRKQKLKTPENPNPSSKDFASANSNPSPESRFSTPAQYWCFLVCLATSCLSQVNSFHVNTLPFTFELWTLPCK